MAATTDAAGARRERVLSEDCDAEESQPHPLAPTEEDLVLHTLQEVNDRLRDPPPVRWVDGEDVGKSGCLLDRSASATDSGGEESEPSSPLDVQLLLLLGSDQSPSREDPASARLTEQEEGKRENEKAEEEEEEEETEEEEEEAKEERRGEGGEEAGKEANGEQTAYPAPSETPPAWPEMRSKRALADLLNTSRDAKRPCPNVLEKPAPTRLHRLQLRLRW